MGVIVILFFLNYQLLSWKNIEEIYPKGVTEVNEKKEKYFRLSLLLGEKNNLHLSRISYFWIILLHACQV